MADGDISVSPNTGGGGGGAVTSVAGRTGDVVVTGADVGAGAFPALRLAAQTSSGTATLVGGTAALVKADTTSGAFTITLPAAPTSGDVVIFEDSAGQWSTNNLTIGLNGKTLNGGSTNPVLSQVNGTFGIIYDGSGWHSIVHPPSDVLPIMDGVAAAGVGFSYARRDHVHPTDTSRAPASGIAPSAITGTAVVTADSRLSDARTPTAHKTSHATGGSDAMTPADIGATTAAAALAAAKAASLDQFAAPAADVAWGSHKITGLANGSGAQDAAAFGQIPLAGGLGGFMKVVRRSSDATGITSATLASDGTLLWALAANEVWAFMGILAFTSTDLTGDCKIGWSVPASATMLWGAMGGQSNNVAGFGPVGNATTPGALLTESQALTVGGFAGTYGVNIQGWVVNSSNAGNANIQFANPGATGTLTPKANSHLLCWRIA